MEMSPTNKGVATQQVRGDRDRVSSLPPLPLGSGQSTPNALLVLPLDLLLAEGELLLQVLLPQLPHPHLHLQLLVLHHEPLLVVHRTAQRRCLGHNSFPDGGPATAPPWASQRTFPSTQLAPSV